MKKLFVLLFLLSQMAQAQWVDDPAVNTLVNANFGSHYVPKIALNQDGSYYISWWGGTSNINMNLALFSHDGFSFWDQALVVSSHPQNTWVDDYNLVADHEGNAVLVFSDVRNGGVKNTVAYKIDAEGNQLWGEDGISLAVAGSSEFNPTAVVNEDNDVFVLFSTNYDNGDLNKIYVHKIEAEGTLSWGANGKIFSGFSSSWVLPYPMANSDGGFSFGFYKETGTFPATVRKIAMIRCDSEGNELWDTEANVTNAGGISAWDDIVLKADGQGGAYFVWNDDRYFDNVAESYAQYINPDGVAQWTENGVVLSDEPGYFQFYAVPGGVNSSGEFTVLWNKVNSNQNMASLMYQRISLDGQRLESANGKTILPLSDRMQNGLHAEQVGDTTFFLYRYFLPSSTFYTSFNMIALDASGDNVWGEPVEMTNSQIERNHSDMCAFYENQAVVVWTDDTGNSSRTMGQNIFIDGALGSSPVGLDEHFSKKADQHFISYRQIEESLQFQDIQQGDEIVLYNLQAQEVLRQAAGEEVVISALKHACYIGRLLRNGKQLESFKFLK